MRLQSAAVMLVATSCGSPPVDVVDFNTPEGRPATSVASVAAYGSAAQPQLQDFAAISVRRRQPAIVERAAKDVPADSTRVGLGLIAEAIEKADADMFVRYIGKVRPSEEDYSDTMHFGTYSKPVVSTDGLAKYGAETLLAYADDWPFLLIIRIKLQATPQDLPGLVWDVHGEEVWFVSLDGVSFLLPKEQLSLGAGAPSKWPDVHDPVLGLAVPFNNVRDQFASRESDEKFLKCAEAAWKQVNTRSEDQSLVVRAGCGRQIAEWERTFAAAVDASVQERAALLAKAKARLATLGGR